VGALAAAKMVSPALAAARFGARQRKGVLLGLSGPRLIVLSVAMLVLTAGLFTAGLTGAALAAPVVLLLAASAFVPVAGRCAVEWAPVAGDWALRRALKQDVYRVRPLALRPAGTLALPRSSFCAAVPACGPSLPRRRHVLRGDDVEVRAELVHDLAERREHRRVAVKGELARRGELCGGGRFEDDADERGFRPRDGELGIR
jgi:hypothetical protein